MAVDPPLYDIGLAKILAEKNMIKMNKILIPIRGILYKNIKF